MKIKNKTVKLFVTMVLLLAMLVTNVPVFALSTTSADIIPVISNTEFKTAWNCDFTTTIYLEGINDFSYINLEFSFNSDLVELKEIVAKDGVSLVKKTDNTFAVEVSSLASRSKLDLVEITFTTSENAPFGTYDLFSVTTEQDITPNLDPLVIYKMGDVNMDGKVNVRDLNAVRQSMLKKTDLTAVQKLYANVYADYESDGTPKINVRDLNYVRQFMLRKKTVLGDRITLTFVYPDETQTQRSMVKGDDFDVQFGAKYQVSSKADTYAEVDFSALTEDTTLYLLVHKHTEVVDAAVAPTCTETGLTEGSHCSVCGEVIKAQDVVPQTGHTYTDGVCHCGAIDEDYKPNVTYSEGLEFESNGDGTCYVVGMGTCKDEDVYIPRYHNEEKVTGIAEGAFEGNKKIKSIILSDTVITVGDLAFMDCENLESVEISESVTSIGDCFVYCFNLENIKVSGKNSTYKSIDGVLYSKDGFILYRCPIAKTEINIPNGVMKIGVAAFESCENISDIKIPNSVVLISEMAFCECAGLTEIEIPYSVKVIDSSAFEGCTNLKTVKLPCDLDAIGDYAFAYCTNLKSIVFGGTENTWTNISKGEDWDKKTGFYIITYEGISDGDDEIFEETFTPSGGLSYTLSNDGYYYIVDGIGTCKDTILVIPETYNKKPVTEIGVGAFKSSKIERAIIPDSIVSIGNSAFAECSNLKSIEVPGSVVSIGNEAFYACIALENLKMDYGVETIGDSAFAECENLTTIKFPIGLESIGEKAFYKCTALTEANMTFGIETIGNSAFAECKSLTKIVLPLGLKNIGEYAFNYCKKITSVEIPGTVISIGYGSFQDCWKLDNVVISNGVLAIEGEAFRDSRIASINIPESVTSIAATSFSSCSYFTDITIDKNNMHYMSDEGVLYSKDGTVCVYYPSGRTYIDISDITETIGSYAFAYNDKLTSIEIPQNVITIELNAFKECYNVQRITLQSGLETICDSAFNGCAKITIIEIPDSVNNIAINAFENCDKLNDILVSDKNAVYSYKNGLLYNKNGDTLLLCPTGKTEVTIPEGVTTIGPKAFGYTSNLKKISLGTDIITIEKSAFSGCDKLTDVKIPNSVKIICDNAFYNCQGLQKIEIPNSVTTIGEDAFNGCHNLLSLKINGNGTVIGESAFMWCVNLLSVEFIGTIASIGDSAFDCCPELRYLTVNGVIEKIGDSSFGYIISAKINGSIDEKYNTLSEKYSESQGLEYVLSGDGTYYIVSSIGTCTDINITVPNVYKGLPVREIGNNAFNYSKIINIRLPDSLTGIGDSAFEGCYSLTAIVIPDSVVTVGERAFRDCYTLDFVVLSESLTSIGKQAFYKCTDLKLITAISDKITSINDLLFYECNKLQVIILPDSLKTIGDQAFHACEQLLDIKLYEGLTSIGKSAFSGCLQLQTINIPSTVTYIGEYAFLECAKLTDIEVPGGVKQINTGVFSYCESLTNVKINEGVEVIGESSFSNSLAYMSMIEIPNSVTTINPFAFYWAQSLTSIVFNGTMVEWEAISKGTSWDYACNYYTVYCTDGNITPGEE